MIKPDIDQFTLVLQPLGILDFDEWRDWVADNIIGTFLIKSKMLALFVEKHSIPIKKRRKKAM